MVEKTGLTLFFAVLISSSLVGTWLINSAYANTAYTVDVDIMADSIALGHPNQNKVLDVEGVSYVFYSDGSQAGYKYSLNHGLTWSNFYVMIDDREVKNGNEFAVGNWEDTVFYVQTNNTILGSSPVDIYVGKGTIESNHIITWGSEVSKDYGSAIRYPSLAVSQDYVYISFSGNVFTYYRCCYARYNHALDTSTYVNPAGGDKDSYSCVMVEDNDIFLIFQIAGGVPWSVTGWDGSLVQITADAVAFGDLIGVSDGTDVYIMAYDTTHYDFYTFISNYVDRGEFFNANIATDSLGDLSLTITDNYPVLYYFVNDVLYNATSTKTSWGSPVSMKDETAKGYLVNNINCLQQAASNGDIDLFYLINYDSNNDELKAISNKYYVAAPNGGSVPGQVNNLFGFIFPFVALIAIGGFAIAIIRGKRR